MLAGGHLNSDTDRHLYEIPLSLSTVRGINEVILTQLLVVLTPQISEGAFISLVLASQSSMTRYSTEDCCMPRVRLVLLSLKHLFPLPTCRDSRDIVAGVRIVFIWGTKGL